SRPAPVDRDWRASCMSKRRMMLIPGHTPTCTGGPMAFRSLFFSPVAVVIIALSGCGDGGESTNPLPTDPAHLDPPPTGQGFQFTTQDIQVAQGSEVQDCFFFKISDLAKAGGLSPTEAINLHQIQVAQRPGSHHMNIFRVVEGPDTIHG